MQLSIGVCAIKVELISLTYPVKRIIRRVDFSDVICQGCQLIVILGYCKPGVSIRGTPGKEYSTFKAIGALRKYGIAHLNIRIHICTLETGQRNAIF